MERLSNLHNIGRVLEEQLNKVGVFTYEQLKKEGSMNVWMKVKNIDSSVCYNRLCALEGAIQGIPKAEISESRKKELKDFYNTFK